ncbi:Acetyltransferase, GNAT family [Sulfitobacter marinus]|uniref:Acetyltransferase, GNAT family n=1 Tax=Sulfitobacter marinus TaxID=394264 RepID=A0A1I6TMA7_9RHOB|nr:GNAT family N-acetyltransferase [Sulfitobacter marinus]SFS90392.1 Acetyltransferase, GNAT family [Sulfitobacter marinus]
MTPNIVSIRPLKPTDSTQAVQVFFDAIHRGTADVYSAEQRQAWAGTSPDIDGWRNRFVGVQGFAAETAGQLAGFMTIDEKGYIDLAFVGPDAMGQGIGRKLYEAVETRAREFRVKALSTHASEKARPFFERMGWSVDRAQTVEKRGVTLTNYKMSKPLA